MNAFDTDVFSEILLGNNAFVSRLSLIPLDRQAIPISVTEEIPRGAYVERRRITVRQVGREYRTKGLLDDEDPLLSRLRHFGREQ